jgi:hypothetical protein
MIAMNSVLITSMMPLQCHDEAEGNDGQAGTEGMSDSTFHVFFFVQSIECLYSSYPR